MNWPQPVCAGCREPTTINAPICARCCQASGLPPPAPFCHLCEAALAVPGKVAKAEKGIHHTKSGGYAGKCEAIK